MAEIEVIVSSKPQENGDDSPPADDLIVDVYSAAIYGDLDKLRGFVVMDGHSVSKPDGNGYYALQWAALNNFPDVVQYIIERGGDVNAADHRQQTALHWAAVKGSIAVADILMQNGIRLEAADIDGYRTVHVAAQYGQTTFLNHMVAKYRADFDAPDKEGRGPLHWAAYKGHSDTVRLLLFRDAYQGRQDERGCTPLHWAALSGNMEACTLLVHAGNKAELQVKDKCGYTPSQLAAERGQHHVAYALSKAMKRRRCENKVWAQLVGNTGYAPILFCFMVLLVVMFAISILLGRALPLASASHVKEVTIMHLSFFSYPFSLEPDFPKVTAVVGLWSWFGVSLAIGSLIMLYRCSSKDPGFIKPNSGGTSVHANDPLLEIDLNSSSTWVGNWSQLCATCKIIRPVRSKHCPTCKHCVEQFDHHCPWISNCVGKRNRWDFFVLVCMGSLTTSIGAAVAAQRIWTWTPMMPSSDTWIHQLATQHPGALIFLFLDITFFCGVFALALTQMSQIARNITTNELANSARYSYLRGPDDRFRNPYNHGCSKNCTDFFIYGYSNEDEIAWPSLQQAAR